MKQLTDLFFVLGFFQTIHKHKHDYLKYKNCENNDVVAKTTQEVRDTYVNNIHTLNNLTLHHKPDAST